MDDDEAGLFRFAIRAADLTNQVVWTLPAMRSVPTAEEMAAIREAARQAQAELAARPALYSQGHFLPPKEVILARALVQREEEEHVSLPTPPRTPPEDLPQVVGPCPGGDGDAAMAELPLVATPAPDQPESFGAESQPGPKRLLACSPSDGDDNQSIQDALDSHPLQQDALAEYRFGF